MDDKLPDSNLIEEKVSSESQIKSDYEFVSVKNKFSPNLVYIISGLILLTVTGVLIYFFFLA